MRVNSGESVTLDIVGADVAEKYDGMISVGDKVRIRWEHLPDVFGTVKYKPCDTGDCWIIEGHGGKVFHIQTFALIEKLS